MQCSHQASFKFQECWANVIVSCHPDPLMGRCSSHVRIISTHYTPVTSIIPIHLKSDQLLVHLKDLSLSTRQQHSSGQILPEANLRANILLFHVFTVLVCPHRDPLVLLVVLPVTIVYGVDWSPWMVRRDLLQSLRAGPTRDVLAGVQLPSPNRLQVGQLGEYEACSRVSFVTLA